MFESHQGYDEETGYFIFSLNKPGLLEWTGFTAVDLNFTMTISDDLFDWLENAGIDYDLHIEPLLSSKPSFIKIKDSESAMLFKLTWL